MALCRPRPPTSDRSTGPPRWSTGVGLTVLAAALGNYLVPVGTGELVAAVVLGAILRRRPFLTGLLLVVAPGAVLVADAVGQPRAGW